MKKSLNRKVSKQPDDESLLEGFLKEFMILVNKGIHDDLEESQDYLDKHELKNYITKDGDLDVGAIEKDEDNLTIHDVLEIGINAGRHATHRNWHKTMDKVAEDHGVKSYTEFSKEQDDDDSNYEVKIVSNVKDLPPELLEAVENVIDSILKKNKKGKK